MGRSDKKSRTSTPTTEKPVRGAAATSTPMPSQPVLTRREDARIPRTTTDNPWRDLHPTRVWPD
jgi:hypothetical protein